MWNLPVLFCVREQLLRHGHRPCNGRTSRTENLTMKAASLRKSRPGLGGRHGCASGGRGPPTTLSTLVREMEPGPYFLELKTYRFRPHSNVRRGAYYRSRAEVAEVAQEARSN